MSPIWVRVWCTSSISLPWNRCWCLCRISSQEAPALKVLTTGTSSSVLMHQQFEQPRAVKVEIRKLFFRGKGRKSNKKAEGKSKILGRGQSAGGKVLELIPSPYGSTQGIFSHSSVLWNTLTTVPCMCWYWQWMAHQRFLQSISRQTTMSPHQESHVNLHLYEWSLYLK